MYSNEIRTINAEFTEKLNPIVVRSSDNLHHILPCLASHVSDMGSYIYIHANFNGKLLLIKFYVRCGVFAGMGRGLVADSGIHSVMVGLPRTV